MFAPLLGGLVDSKWPRLCLNLGTILFLKGYLVSRQCATLQGTTRDPPVVGYRLPSFCSNCPLGLGTKGVLSLGWNSASIRGERARFGMGWYLGG